MRLIGTVPSKQHAEKISAYLLTHEISTHCEADPTEGNPTAAWQVWVRDEDRMEDAKQHLEEFRQNPDDARYKKAVEEALRIAREKEKQAQQAKANQIQMTSDRWNAPIHKVAPLTVAIVVICSIVALLTGFGEQRDTAVIRALAFASLTNEQAIQAVGGDAEALSNYSTPLRLGSLLRGEVWRAVTPIFLHWGVFHLLFNMYWLVFFGRQIEYRYGTKWLALLVVLIAIPSNISGCIVPENLDGVGIGWNGMHWLVLLGGMSGVIYGLFGYVWMKMIFDPKSGLFVSMTAAAFILVWMVICMMPDDSSVKTMLGIRNIGNWAHAIGLIVGLLIGYAPKLMEDLGMTQSSGNGDKSSDQKK